MWLAGALQELCSKLPKQLVVLLTEETKKWLVVAVNKKCFKNFQNIFLE